MNLRRVIIACTMALVGLAPEPHWFTAGALFGMFFVCGTNRDQI